MPASAVLSTDRPLSHRLLVVQHASIFESYGGVEYYLDDIARLSGHLFGKDSVCVVCPERGPRKGNPTYPAHFVPLATSGWRRKWQNRFAWPLFVETKRQIVRFKPTAVINGHVSLGPLVWAATRGTGIPWWTIAYGIEAWGGGWPQDEWALRQCDGIISISHWTKKILVDRKFSASKIAIVQPPLPEIFSERPYHPPTPGRPFTCLTVSRLDAQEQYKGQDHVLHALAKLRRSVPQLNLRYVIQGNGTDRPRLESLCRSLSLSDCVEFRDAVKDRAGLEATYTNADLFVMPSRFGRWGKAWKGEGFGIVYLEAAAFGLPSLAYDCGGVTDIVRSEENGILVPPDDIDALAEGILRLATQPAKVKEMGKRAYEQVMRDFSFRRIGEQMNRAIAELSLHSTPPRR